MMFRMPRCPRLLLLFLILTCGALYYFTLKDDNLRYQGTSNSHQHRVPPPNVGGNSEEASPARQRPTSLATFQQRKKRLEAACTERRNEAANNNNSKLPAFPYHTMWTGSLAFCPLPKTGTTTWKRILYYMDQGLKGRLLDTAYGDIHTKTMYMQNKRIRYTPGKKYKSIVFVREPYARLFAAYVDKLFTPRRSNWRKYGTPVVSFTRTVAPGNAPNSLCAHDVTFQEFVRYFIAVETGVADYQRDEHFVPLSHQCGFCHETYDLIGRQESFADDTLGMLAVLNAQGLLHYSDFEQNYEKYEMDALIRYTFEHELDSVHHCMSKEQALRHLWKALQIRGTIAAEEFFPLSTADCEQVDADSFLQIAENSYNKSIANPSRHFNRLESMHEGFSTVHAEDRLRLRKIFEDDFKFFDYDPNNPYVFPKDDEFKLAYYRYFDVYDTFLFQSGPMWVSQHGQGSGFGNVHEELPKSLRAPRRGKLDGGGMKTAVFVRDPYTRLLFAYIDKLFRPRLDYWRTYGKPILTHVRGHEETDLSRMCASDVTFAEFIRYLVMSELEKKTKVSPHFYPISRQCGLCNEPENLSVVYDFIGKTETYATDAPAILKAVGLYDRLPHDFDLGVAYRQRNMELLVNYTFRRHLSEPLSTMCTSKAETLVRVWRILQIRGIFSTSESFPFSNTSAEDVTYGQFLQTSRAAFKRSLEDRSLSGNVNTAMKEAYSTVPLADRKALQRIFHRDFLLFQYPSSVPGVFPENDRFQLDRFHFFDVFHERFKEKTAEL
nr:hypothetical protein BaRGS_009915 [Batillaria attramentaria]